VPLGHVQPEAAFGPKTATTVTCHGRHIRSSYALHHPKVAAEPDPGVSNGSS
jgi:hypothetical protein